MTTRKTLHDSGGKKVRVSLQAKLTLAFVCVSLIGFVLAFGLLPRLYLNSKEREIDASEPGNVGLLVNSFAAWVAVSDADPANRAKEVVDLLRESKDFDFSGIELDQALAPDEALEVLRETRPTDSLKSLEKDFETIKSIFRVVRFVPWRVTALKQGMSLLSEGNPPQYYWPILVSLSLPERGFEGTLALGGFVQNPLEFDAENDTTELFTIMRELGLKMVSRVLFYTAEELRQEGSWAEAQEKRDLPYWGGSPEDESGGERRLWVPVKNAGKKDELAGLFCLIYEPAASLPVWQDLAGGPGYAALVAAAFLAVIFSIFFAKGITRPVQELTRGALAIADGKLDRSVRVSTGDEIGVLADTFNQMTERLRRTLDQLRQRAETIEKQNLELDRRFNELRTLQNYTENILKTVESAIFSVDLEGNVRRPNRAACDLLGLEDGQPIDSLDADALRERLNAALELGESTVSDEISVVSPAGEKVPVAVSVSPLREEEAILGSVAVLTDLQAIKNLEALVRRQERLAALGQLTAGVAHEVRNPLSIIKACAEILQQKFGDRPEENGLSRDILEETNRLSRVVTNFLSFARPAEPNFSPEDLNELIDRFLDRMEREEEWELRIERRFSDRKTPVEVDRDQVEQVLLNLIRNADDAMKGEGTIALRTGSSGDGESAWFEVQDEGAGMDEETLKKIFDPFFTSKAKGTGLGLSICHRIMEAHGGRIEVVETWPAQGTLFRATFPRTVGHAIKPLEGETAHS